MEINVRKTGEYKDVTITEENVVISCGLLNFQECLDLAKTLKSGIWDLLYDDKEQYDQLMEKE